LPLTPRNISSARWRSLMTAANSISGTATTQSSTFRDSTFSIIDGALNGPRPCIPLQVEIKAIPNNDVLSPPKPKRSDAHKRSGSGTYTSAGILFGETF
jgi:hypothetical protein